MLILKLKNRLEILDPVFREGLDVLGHIKISEKFSYFWELFQKLLFDLIILLFLHWPLTTPAGHF